MYRSLGALPTDDELRVALATPGSAALAPFSNALDAATKKQLMEQFTVALPTYWGARSQHCVSGAWDKVPMWDMARCHALAYGYVADPAAAQAAVDQIPDVDERAPLNYALMAGGIGVLAGIAIGMLIR